MHLALPLLLMSTLSYGPDVKQAVDVYAPSTPGPHPVVLFLHGGVWQRGDRAHYAKLGADLADAGFVAFIASYRLAPAHRWPAQLDDAAAALALTLREASARGGDPERVIVMGHSAGGQLAALLAQHDTPGIAALALFSPVSDLRAPLDEAQVDGGFRMFVAPVFGTDERTLKAASPLQQQQVKRSMSVPVLLVTSARDYQAMRAQTFALARALGVGERDVLDLSGLDHFEMVARLEPSVREQLRALVARPLPAR